MNGPEISNSLDDVCVLVDVKETRGDRGERISNETENEIFCRRKSISQSEFFKAQQTGLRSDLCLIVWWDDYSGEKIVKYNNVKYDVYRTYERGDDFIELYLAERVGVSGKTDQGA